MSLATASCSDVYRSSELRRESELDPDQALVSTRMSGLTLTASALVDACGGVSVIGTSTMRSGGVTVLALGTARGFAATAGFGASVAVGPDMVSVGGAAATVPVDECGAESAVWVSAPSSGGLPERGG